MLFHLSQHLDGPDVIGTDLADTDEAGRHAIVTLGQVIQRRSEIFPPGADLLLTVMESGSSCCSR